MIALPLVLCLLPALQGVVLQSTPQPQQKGQGQAIFGLPGPGAAQGGGVVVFGDADQDGLPEARLLRAPSQGRAWIGVVLATEDGGALGLGVNSVSEGSPAQRAGLREGDRIVALAGERIEDYPGLIARLGELRPGQEVGLTIRRTLPVGLDRRGWRDDEGPRLGVSLSERESDGGTALIVTEVREDWPAAAAGLREGDRLVSADGRELTSFELLRDVLAGVEPGNELLLGVERRVELTLGTSPAQTAPAPGGGFFFEAPDEPQPAPDRFRAMPVPMPVPELQPRGAEIGALREEMRNLAQELRALREELSSLRRELAELRSSRER